MGAYAAYTQHSTQICKILIFGAYLILAILEVLAKIAEILYVYSQYKHTHSIKKFNIWDIFYTISLNYAKNYYTVAFHKNRLDKTILSESTMNN